MGSNPAVGAGFFPARKTGVCYGYGAGVALGSQTEHSCLVHLIITPCISCLPYAREPEARPLGWLALKNYTMATPETHLTQNDHNTLDKERTISSIFAVSIPDAIEKRASPWNSRTPGTRMW